MISLVITDGFGNGTLAGSVSDVILHGYSIGEYLSPWTDISDTTTTWTDLTDESTIWTDTVDESTVWA